MIAAISDSRSRTLRLLALSLLLRPAFVDEIGRASCRERV